MSFLDKLKPLPRWKHTDPAVRLEGVRELEDATEIALLAETDPEARVRLAAIARLNDATVLGRVQAGDPDHDARERAADRLHALATNGSTADVALAAVQGLTDPRRLSAIAKGDYSALVRAEALSRTDNERALSAIARHAKHTVTASAALERLTDQAQLAEVATAGDHPDVAIAAFDRLASEGADLSVLKSIAAKTNQKVVGQRAAVVISEIEKLEADRLAAEEALRRQAATTCEGVEQLRDASDATAASAALQAFEETWQTLKVTDNATRDRFAQGVSAAKDTIARLEREAEEAAELARRRAEAIATRDALGERVETLEGDDVLEQLVPIEEEWRSLMPLVGNGPEADRVAERFALAVAACRKRHEMGALLADARDKLAALVAEAEELLSRKDAAAASARWQSLSREARGLTATLSEASRPAVELNDKLTAVGLQFEARKHAAREALEKAQEQVAAQLQRLADRSRRVTEAENVTLREGERLMRDIVAGLDQIGRVQPNRAIDEAARKVRSLQEKVAPRVHDLREMDDWRRFANGQQQEKLIAMAEAIVASLKADEEASKDSDLAATARALRELHAKWQEVAEGPRHSAQQLWDRFRTATDAMRSRCAGYFSQMREERSKNLEAKTSLVDEAESLAQSSDWGKAATRFRDLQTAWQAVGSVPRDGGRELAQRFRTACNVFFARRREDMAERKKTWSENLARKEALCERVEALAESTEWDKTASEIKRLQADWKTIGPIRRNKSEAVWKRFRTAADRFFDRFHHRHEIALAGKLAERDAVVAELESLVGAEADTPPEDLAQRVQKLRSDWNRSVPLPPAEMKPLVDRWQASFTRLAERWPEALKGTDLDPEVVGAKLEKLVAKVEAFVAAEPAPDTGVSQTELLASRLRDALASNAIGGRANEASKWRTAADAVKEAQGAWQRLALLAATKAGTIEGRFKKACRRVNDEARRHGAADKRPPQRTKTSSPRKTSRPPRRPARAAAG